MCETGKHAHDKGSTVCAFCASGWFSEFDGLQNCTICPIGKSAVEKSQRCFECYPGLFSVGGQGVCTPCFAGKFNTQFELPSCSSCSKGQAQPATGQTKCLDCVPGRYQANRGESNCVECKATDASQVNIVSTDTKPSCSFEKERSCTVSAPLSIF